MLEPYILHKWACYDLPLICMCWLFMPTVIIEFLFSHVTSISIISTAASLIQVSPEWPGLPIGVKFDPSDVELLEHLAAKCGVGNSKPHMFIDEFIPTIEGDQGIAIPIQKIFLVRELSILYLSFGFAARCCFFSIDYSFCTIM